MTPKPLGTSTLIRDAQPFDLAAISDLQREAILTLSIASYGDAGAAAWARWQSTDVLDLLARGGTFLVGEDVSGVTAVGGWLPDATNPLVAWVRAVFVSPRRARQGLGTELMARIEESAAATGRIIFRLVASANAIRFYEAIGYSTHDRRAWEVEPGIILQCSLMEKTRQIQPRALDDDDGPHLGH